MSTYGEEDLAKRGLAGERGWQGVMVERSVDGRGGIREKHGGFSKEKAAGRPLLGGEGGREYRLAVCSAYNC